MTAKKPDTVVITLHIKRVIYIQMLQHAMAAVILLLAALEHLEGDETATRLLAIAEILVVALLLGAIILERIHLRHGKDTPVNWVDIAAGLLAICEAINLRAEGHSWALAGCYLFVGLLLSVKGILMHRMINTRRIELSRQGLLVRTSRFRSFFSSWEDLEKLDIDTVRLAAVRADGRAYRLPFSHLLNGVEVSEKLLAALPELIGTPDPPQSRD